MKNKTKENPLPQEPAIAAETTTPPSSKEQHQQEVVQQTISQEQQSAPLSPTKKHYLSHLRIMAAFFVIAIHVSSPFLKTSSAWSASWVVLTILETIIRVAVPLFVMISGALFLDEAKKVPLKKLLIHNVLRLVVIFFAWAYVYRVADNISNNGFYWGALSDAFSQLAVGEYKYHLWFLPMLIGLYLLTPLLRCICKKENKKIVEYFLIIFVIAAGGLNYLSGLNFGTVVNTTLDIAKQLDPSIFVNFIGYFVLGWYLATFDFSAKFRKWLYIIGFGQYGGGILLSFLYAWLTNTASIITTSSYSIFCIISCATLFVAFRYSKYCNKPNKIVDFVANTTFGIYLTHPFVRNLVFSWFGWGYRWTCYTAWGLVLIPVYVLVMFILSCVVTLLFNIIPKKVRRWMI